MAAISPDEEPVSITGTRSWDVPFYDNEKALITRYVLIIKTNIRMRTISVEILSVSVLDQII